MHANQCLIDQFSSRPTPYIATAPAATAARERKGKKKRKIQKENERERKRKMRFRERMNEEMKRKTIDIKCLKKKFNSG